MSQIKIKYQVHNCNGKVGAECDSLREAVLEAAGYDGYGAQFQRNESGAMRLYSSARHLGNNPYFPAEGDEFGPASDLLDDSAAEVDVAEQIRADGILHSRYHDLYIEERTYEGGVLTRSDGGEPDMIAITGDCETN